MTDAGFSRREFGGAAAAIALLLGIPVAGVWLTDAERADVVSERQQVMLEDLAQLLIPRTDTPGAGEAGAAEFVILALAHGLNGTADAASAATSAWGLANFTRGDGTLDYLAWLENRLDRAVGGNWVGKDEQVRFAALEKLDSEAYPPGPPPTDPSPWRQLKAMILTGYYTSEIGGSQELRFNLVPGRFDPDLPLTPDYRAWSSDWIALEFG